MKEREGEGEPDCYSMCAVGLLLQLEAWLKVDKGGFSVLLIWCWGQRLGENLCLRAPKLRVPKHMYPCPRGLAGLEIVHF